MRQIKKNERFQVSIVKQVSVVVLAVGISLGALFFYGSSQIILSLSHQITDGIAERVMAHTDNFLSRSATFTEIVSSHLMVNAKAEKKPLDIVSKREAIWADLWPFLVATPSLQSFFVADTQGSYVQVRREPRLATRYIDRSIEPAEEHWYYRDSDYTLLDSRDKSPTFDPRIRPWYLNTLNKKRNFWTDVYVFTTAQTPGLSVTYPVLSPSGALEGVVCANTPLHSLSAFLRQQQVGQNGFAYIVNDKGEIIAHPGDKDQIVKNTLDKKRSRLLRYDELEKGWWSKAFGLYKDTGERYQTFSYKDVNYIATVVPFDREYANGWNTVLVMPEDDVLGPVKDVMWRSAGIAALIALFALWGISYVSRVTARQIEALAHETRHIRSFELDSVESVNSRIHEVSMLNDSFLASVEALKSFAKYVPSELVRQLLEANESIGIGGKAAKVTILFSDIEGFGKIAESMPSDELMLHLSEYFDHLTRITMEEMGTVDKYMGDALMAFWGQPIALKETSLHACRAVLRMRNELEGMNDRWTKQGKPCFPTRFGLHTGNVTVGNMGSSDRLNYTIIGDDVNVAARLEALNRDYKTSIIISEEVYKEVAHVFECRYLDSVNVKGHMEAVAIYELVDEVRSANDEDLGVLSQLIKR